MNNRKQQKTDEQWNRNKNQQNKGEKKNNNSQSTAESGEDTEQNYKIMLLIKSTVRRRRSGWRMHTREKRATLK